MANARAAITVVAPNLETESERSILHFDLGQAVMSMMLAAADLGIGTGHAAVTDQDLAREILGFPHDRFCAHMLSLGYPAGDHLHPLKKVNRRPFDQVVHRQHW